MADRLNEPSEPARASEEHAAEAPLAATVALSTTSGDRRRSSPHSKKFFAVTATLFGVAVCAVAVAVAIALSGSSSGPAAAWSSWSPSDSGVAGEREIADQVAPFYRASPATQLVVVTAQNISGSSANGTQIAIRDPNSGALAALSGSTAVYNLCGLGPNCAIATGAPSSARLLLLRREALELALYTFRYISGIDNVVAILPPGHTTATATLTPKPPAPGKTATSTTLNIAVVFQHQELQHLLDRPLRMSLPEPLPPAVAQMPNAPEAELVSVITSQALFQEQSIQSQDGSNVLVLNQLPPQ